MNRRKGVPCGCDADPCGCSPKNHCVKAINNVSPDPNGDFNIKAGAGIAITQTGDDEITIVNAATPSAYIAGTNIEFTPSGADTEINVVDDPVIDGTLTVNGDIIQNGAAYETHAEKVYTTNDYIIMRDGAVGALAVGDYAGFQVEKYDGTNDGRLVMDRDGVARVGDVGDEQPLLTRSESAQLNNGDLLQWNGTDQKAVSASLNTSQIVRGSGNIGSDTKPVKIVNGVATAVTDDLCKRPTARTFNSWDEFYAYLSTIDSQGRIALCSISYTSWPSSFFSMSFIFVPNQTLTPATGTFLPNGSSDPVNNVIYYRNSNRRVYVNSGDPQTETYFTIDQAPISSLTVYEIA